MADEEQLGILSQGPDAWNAWRQDQSFLFKPDLRGAYLGDASL